MAYDEDLANRIRELISTEPDLTEKRMFGGRSFLIGGRMSVSVRGQGGLLLRCDPADTEQLRAKPNAGPFEMRGRVVDGWLAIDPEGLRTKRQLARWVALGVTYARSLPPKGGREATPRRALASWEDVGRIALALPEASERISRDLRQWRVKDKLFVWERPLRRKEIEALGSSAPDGPILGARVEHLGAKEALLADDPSVFFTTPHFDGHPSILVRLERIALRELDEVIVEAWLSRAPEPLARRYIDTQLAPRGE